MRLLVTGAAGFIGSNFLRMIANGELQGFSSVKVLDKLTYAGVRSNLDSVVGLSWYEFIQGDICDLEVVSELLREVDAVVNFAAESHVDRSISGAADFVQTNIVGAQVLLDAIKASGKRIRFLQVSTDEVYGSIESGSWTEDWPLQPNSPYSASKASGELLARSYNKTHGMDVVITRCSNNYGSHHFPEKLIPLFITNLIEGKKVPVYGTGENIRDWLHVDDHCRGIATVLESGRAGEVYNIAGTDEFENIELARKIIAFFSKSEADTFDFVEDRKGHDIRYSLTGNKSRKELNIGPKINFEDGLKETIEWYVNNESWWRPLLKK
jgi:dTDP-glucose 4,6-dehydratase